MFEDSVSSIPSIWASMISWFTPTVLFLLLNLMIGTIVIISSLGTTQKHHESTHYPNHHHHQAHPQLARSPSMLQRLTSINFYSYRSQEPNLHFHKPHETETHFAFTQQQHQPQEPVEPQPHHFTRSPSTMLQKLKSINFYHYISQEYIGPSSQAQAQDQAHLTPEPEPEPTHFDFEPEHPKNQELDEEEEGHDQLEAQSLDDIYSQLKGGAGGQVTRSKSDTKPTPGEVPPAKLSKKMKKSASANSAFSHFEEDDIVESRRPATVREGKASSKVTEVDDDEVDAKADDFINKFKQQLKLQRLDSFSRNKEMIGRGAGK